MGRRRIGSLSLCLGALATARRDRYVVRAVIGRVLGLGSRCRTTTLFIGVRRASTAVMVLDGVGARVFTYAIATPPWDEALGMAVVAAVVIGVRRCAVWVRLPTTTAVTCTTKTGNEEDFQLPLTAKVAMGTYASVRSHCPRRSGRALVIRGGSAYFSRK